MNPWKSRPSYLTWVRVEYLYLRRIWWILVESNRCIYVFDHLWSPNFSIPFDDESRVVTQLCQYLQQTYFCSVVLSSFFVVLLILFYTIKYYVVFMICTFESKINRFQNKHTMKSWLSFQKKFGNEIIWTIF